MEVGQHARWQGWPLFLLRCLSAETESEPGEQASGIGKEAEGKEATDCQIAVWQSSVASGTVTTAASVVVAVKWRQDREKNREKQGRVGLGRTVLIGKTTKIAYSYSSRNAVTLHKFYLIRSETKMETCLRYIFFEFVKAPKSTPRSPNDWGFKTEHRWMSIFYSIWYGITLKCWRSVGRLLNFGSEILFSQKGSV